MRSRPRKQRATRRGAASIEMAFVAPIFVTLIVGLAQVGSLLDAQTNLAAAARLAARLATMDRSNLLSDGQTTNDKLLQDVRTSLDANGLPGDQAEIHVVDPNDHSTPFDLDDPANDLKLFELRVELPYSAVTGLSSDDWSLKSTVVFRNARASLVQ